MEGEKKKVFCKVCKEVELEDYYTSGDGQIVVPVYYAPTMEDYCKIYKEIVGTTIQENTDEQDLSKIIEKTWLPLTHLNPEDDGRERAREHQFTEEIECWIDII